MKTLCPAYPNIVRNRSTQAVRWFLAGVLLLMLFAIPSQLQATPYTWTNGAGGAWTTTTNWDVGGSVPDDNTDAATLPTIGGGYTVTVNSNPTIAQLDITGSTSTLSLGSNLTVDPVPTAGTTSSNSGTINIDNKTLSIITNTFTQAGLIQANGGTLRFGYGGTGFNTNDINTVVDWTTGSDITGPYRFLITSAAEVTVNRTTPWNVLSGQTIEFGVNTPGQNVDITVLTLDRDMNNSGTILMGTSLLGYAHTFLNVNSTNSTFTNNAGGVFEMYPRNNGSADSQWSYRNLQAELVNAGNFNVYTHAGFLGKAVAGIDHVNTGDITFYNTYTSNAYAASLTVTGSSITNDTTGTIGGNGILNVSAVSGGLINDGTLSPGMSAGVLNITGNVTNSSTSQLVIELGGTTVGTVNTNTSQYDQLNVSGAFAIDGELLVTLIDGFENTITSSDTFTIVTYGSHSGMFSNADGTVIVANNPYLGFEVSYLANSIVLSNFFQLPVPEPSSGWLVLGVVGLAVRRRRKANQLIADNSHDQ